MSNTSFGFRHVFLLSAHFSQSQTTSCLGIMSYHQVNNKCNGVKRWHWRWLIYALYISLLHIMFTCFQKQLTTTILESFTNSTGQHQCWSLFLKICGPAGLFQVCFFLSAIIHVNYVLWSFILYILLRFVLPLYMHKTLSTLGNEKEQ